MPLVNMRDMLYHAYDNHYRFTEHHCFDSFLKKPFNPNVSDSISIDYQEKR